MLVVDISPDDELNSAVQLSNTVVDLNLEFDVVLSPLLRSKEKHEKYKYINPLFVNEEKERNRIVA